MRASRSYILTYHSLDSSGSVISIPPTLFRAQMEFLAGSGIPVVPLADVQRVPGSVALTFDDGFRNFLQHALPVLCEFRLPATVFVVSGHCGRSNDWESQPAGVPRLELMSWPELCEIVRHGVSLGAHTVSHPHLTALARHELRRELRASQSEIQDRTGQPADILCYPYGDENGTVRAVAGAFFRAACGTDPAPVSSHCGPLQLPRIDAYYLQAPFWFESLGTLRGRGYLAARRTLRRMRDTLGIRF